MANDSSTGGYLSPESAAPLDDGALDLLIGPAIAGITGLDGSLVRRKGQDTPPPQPGRTTTWCAFAVTATKADNNASYVHYGDDDGGLGTSIEIRTEYLEVTASFYGPAARGNAALLRDGLGITQNRDALRASGLAYVDMDRITFVPDLENTQFVRRADLVFNLRRMAVRTYPIRNLLSAPGTIIAPGVPTVTATFDAES